MRPRSSSQNPWVQLYEARRVYNEPESRPPGRPPALIPRRKVGLTLSQGEISELSQWQQRFSTLLNRKVSTGETVGILTRICSARLANLETRPDFVSLHDLVEQMIGGMEESSSEK
ncbi:MAG TPA: hypothetical protein GYA06_11015 [Chloroflexi bacterium]|nr:hypothetical protein [Chloroflexota bacterium]